MQKIGFWTLLSIPAAVVCARYFSDAISYGEAIHQSGQWSVGLLVATLALTPLRRTFGNRFGLAALLRHRRAIGVASFCYAALHTAFYLEHKWGADLILKEGLQVSLATGWVALAIFSILALTSNDTCVRKLGRSWKALHRTVYIATILTFAHWWLATFDPTTAYVYAGLLIIIQSLRLR